MNKERIENKSSEYFLILSLQFHLIA